MVSTNGKSETWNEARTLPRLISTSSIGTAAVQNRPLGGIPALKSWMCPWPTGPVKRSSQNTPNAARCGMPSIPMYSPTRNRLSTLKLSRVAAPVAVSVPVPAPLS